jgi:hypothetical protein
MVERLLPATRLHRPRWRLCPVPVCVSTCAGVACLLLMVTLVASCMAAISSVFLAIASGKDGSLGWLFVWALMCLVVVTHLSALSCPVPVPRAAIHGVPCLLHAYCRCYGNDVRMHCSWWQQHTSASGATALKRCWRCCRCGPGRPCCPNGRDKGKMIGDRTI